MTLTGLERDLNLLVSSSNKITVLFHGNCYDGFGAAYAAWKLYGDSAEYVPCFFSEGSVSLDAIATGSEVYVVDYSFPREDLLRNVGRFSKLVVLDHHATAEENLRGLDFCVFDMERSGAMIAWNYFHPDQEPPDLIKHIQDRDLWLFKLPFTKFVHLALVAEPFNFQVWDRLDVPTLVVSGQAMLKLQTQQVENICSKAVLMLVGTEVVPVANTSMYFSEVPSRLLELYPEAKFAAYYYDRSSHTGLVRQWGLRSRGDFDVSAVARQYGGGGHRAAAGFVRPAPESV
jgi:hypothetical protein